MIDDSIQIGGAKILAALPLPLVICSGSLVIMASNESFGRQFKLKAGEIKGKGLFGVLGSELWILEKDQEKILTGLNKLVKGKIPKVVFGVFPKIGRRVFNLFTRSLKINGQQYSLIMFQNVTEEDEKKKIITNISQELRSIFDGIDDPHVMIDTNYRIRRINERMLKALSGKSYKHFIGMPCHVKLHGRRDRCPGCTADETITSSQKTMRVGFLECRKDYDQFNYQIVCHPLKNKEGNTVGVAESYRDVTELQHVQEELYESERTRSIQPLAAGIAHEIRNPLAVIQSTAQYIQGRVKDDEDVNESLEAILKSAEDANRVISELINFAKPSDMSLKQEPLSSVLEESIKLIRGRAKQCRVVLDQYIPNNLPKLFLDRKRFQQAIINFFVNSLDVMPDGGRLDLQARHNRLEQSCEIAIRDTGPGVPEEVVSKLFQPFYSTKKNGVGLGLAIAEGIIRDHGGKVTFRSKLGEESEVLISVPIKKEVDAKVSFATMKL
jgi:signal transduction histidine kinase